MVQVSGLFMFALAVSLAELPERLQSAEADAADIAPPGLAERAARCVDDAWAEMEIRCPAEGFVSALGAPLELQATFPACLDMPGVWASIEIRYLGKTTKRVQHRGVTSPHGGVRAPVGGTMPRSRERQRHDGGEIVTLSVRLPNPIASSCFPSRSGRTSRRSLTW